LDSKIPERDESEEQISQNQTPVSVQKNETSKIQEAKTLEKKGLSETSDAEDEDENIIDHPPKSQFGDPKILAFPPKTPGDDITTPSEVILGQNSFGTSRHDEVQVPDSSRFYDTIQCKNRRLTDDNES
jgi:hypothetical protein